MAETDCGPDVVADRLTGLAGLAPALAALDELLDMAVHSARSTLGASVEADPYRGLYINESDASRLLQAPPGDASFGPLPVATGWSERCDALDRIQREFELSDFDVAALVIAVARDVDLRYERLYAYLQDDVTRRAPTVELILNLLSACAEDKLRARSRFAADAPLIRSGLARLVGDPQQPCQSLLSHFVAVDEQVVRALIGQPHLDHQLGSYCRTASRRAGAELPTDPVVRHVLRHLISDARRNRERLHVLIHGSSPVMRRQLAAAIAEDIGAPLLRIDVAAASSKDPDRAVASALREARLQDQVPLLERMESVPFESVGRALAMHPRVALLSSDRRLDVTADDVQLFAIDAGGSGFAERRAWWRCHLDGRSIGVTESTVDALADRFRLSGDRIGEVVESAAQAARQRGAAGVESGPRPLVTADDLFAAARRESSQALGTLARKVEPVYSWHDIVLPSRTMTQLHDICHTVEQRPRVLGAWGFGRKLAIGKGVTALFVGPSGVGKTMAADVVASALRLDLYKIDLSGVVSKYIGETEKNLDRIFAVAEQGNAILLFDEADALFGKRSEVRDSHDRYANIEVSYLLQKMEQYEGIAILSTNLRTNMDDAFLRRLQFVVEFEFPTEERRRSIWQVLLPAEAPRGRVDFEALARLRLSGGSIKNVTLGAAFLAAADGSAIGMTHLARAAEREYEKLGRSLPAQELTELAVTAGHDEQADMTCRS